MQLELHFIIITLSSFVVFIHQLLINAHPLSIEDFGIECSKISPSKCVCTLNECFSKIGHLFQVSGIEGCNLYVICLLEVDQSCKESFFPTLSTFSITVCHRNMWSDVQLQKNNLVGVGIPIYDQVYMHLADSKVCDYGVLPKPVLKSGLKLSWSRTPPVL